MNNKSKNKQIIDFIVWENRKISSDYFLLDLRSKNALPAIYPGQFAQVKVDGSNSIFLRRPLSIHDVDFKEKSVKLLVHIVGEGTRALSKLQHMDMLNLVFPLGNAFSLPKGKSALLVGGGCGMAPMLYLAKYLKESNVDVTVVLGGKSKKDILMIEDFVRYAKVVIMTNDGTLGNKGMVTDSDIFDTQKFDKIYCCGPLLMMKAVAKKAKTHKTECEVSLETTMACGVGACLCCVTKQKGKHVCVCTEGPVFNPETLDNF